MPLHALSTLPLLPLRTRLLPNRIARSRRLRLPRTLSQTLVAMRLILSCTESKPFSWLNIWLRLWLRRVQFTGWTLCGELPLLLG